MRPAALTSLFSSVTNLKGIGAKVEKLLLKLVRSSAREGETTVRLIDLLLHLPSGVIDRRERPTIDSLPQEGIVTIEVTVGKHSVPPRHNKRVPYRIDCFDDTGTIGLVFFHIRGDYLQRLLPVGEKRFISGRIEWYSGMPQMVHPDHMLSASEFAKMPLLEPVYPLTAGVSGKTLGKAIQQALGDFPTLPEWQEPNWLAKQKSPSFADALARAHSPQDGDDLEPHSPLRERLAYDELLANQLALGLVRKNMKSAAGRVIDGDGRLRRQIVETLPYKLTKSQEFSIKEILRDMATNDRMLRLLQGDVGAGKTIVAVMALLAGVEIGAQGALMVPTEILARQHFSTISSMCNPIGVRVELLTGRDKGKVREEKLARLMSGEIDILIGTHALFQNDVQFADLALVVIDEQHRFGVHQRLALQSKAQIAPDVLVMTATPIPRTLTLTLYGDMEVSRLTEKPAGRQPIDTRVIPMERLGDVANGLGRALEKNARIYWVCPLVEDSDVSNLTAAQDRFEYLNKLYPGQVGLIHGRMKPIEKDEVMGRFQRGEISVLVATTVIEVGVDVPEASVMVIENAEQFGLAQLHQLRGRVGRGSQKSSCVLLYQGNPGETASSRLGIMRDTEDGFLIAEEDLRLRGSGELLGVRQSGVAAFRLANPIEHRELLFAARDDVELILASDPYLTSKRGEALKTLLYLFDRDSAIRLLRSG